MALRKLWVIAYRDLGRNRRRSLLTLIAVALGLALIILMSGYISGVLDGALQNSIELQTGHVQLRADSYEEEKLSLLWRDLLEDPAGLASRAQRMDEVESASPVLWSSGVLSTIQETVGLRVTGIDPNSDLHAHIREGIVVGEYLKSEERGGILMGKRLADKMGIEVGQRVSLVSGHSDGRPEEAIFTVQGLFATGVPGYDENTVFMTLSQAQAVTGAGEHASAIVIRLYDQDDANQVAAALQGTGITALTWEDLNSLLLEAVAAGLGFYYLMYGIVILVVAVIIANTLLMAVFERTREMGILAALGMKGRQIMTMILLEAGTLALMGTILGIILGTLLVWYLSINGIDMGEDVASIAEGMAYPSVLYAKFAPGAVIGLSLAMLGIVLLASLYPARFAARMEPVEALHSV
jgi:ABC-type lipoprotein release transport system permease subunit